MAKLARRLTQPRSSGSLLKSKPQKVQRSSYVESQSRRNIITDEYQEQLNKEFDRQLKNLLEKGYPKIANLKAEDLIKVTEPLRRKLTELPMPNIEIREARIPFVLVVKNDLIPAETAMPLIEIKGQSGYVDMRPVDSKSFTSIEGLQIPTSPVYLVVDVDTGQETLNVTPFNALRKLQRQNRLPLVIDEGVALVTHFPEVLIDRKNYNCFSLLGSRRDDQRVPAMWMSYKKPRLGWCWDNNPHTWLGSASCDRRIGV